MTLVVTDDDGATATSSRVVRIDTPTVTSQMPAATSATTLAETALGIPPLALVAGALLLVVVGGLAARGRR